MICAASAVLVVVTASALLVAARPRVAAEEKLTVSRARRAIARVAGIELPTDAVEVEKENISVLGSSAVVEARVRTAFRLRQTERGQWEVAEIRLGDNRWEDVALLRQALDREKTARAQVELQLIAFALEAFRRERGGYPPVASHRELIDHISPRYLPAVIRLDPWQQPYEYEGTRDAYRLRSTGADRKTGTADDVTLDLAK